METNTDVKPVPTVPTSHNHQKTADLMLEVDIAEICCLNRTKIVSNILQCFVQSTYIFHTSKVVTSKYIAVLIDALLFVEHRFFGVFNLDRDRRQQHDRRQENQCDA